MFLLRRTLECDNCICYIMLFDIAHDSYDGLEASLSDLGSCVSERRETVAALRAANMELIVGLYSSWTDYE